MTVMTSSLMADTERSRLGGRVGCQCAAAPGSATAQREANLAASGQGSLGRRVTVPVSGVLMIGLSLLWMT
jgi:hypothetical protein